MTTPSDKQDVHQILSDSTNALKQAKSDPKFASLLKGAKGVIVFPTLVKGAVVVGGEGGQGVLLSHKNGKWSDPAFLSIGSISFGAQAGGEAGPVIFVLETDKALNDFTEANNFSLNANAGLTIVNYSARTQGNVGKGDVVLWSKTAGAFAGVDVSGTDITANSAENRAFYGKSVTAADILAGKTTNPQADALRNSLPS